MGFDQDHVVGIWVGRPDGTALPGATGRDLALPLLSRVFDLLLLAPRESESRFMPRANLGQGTPFGCCFRRPVR